MFLIFHKTSLYVMWVKSRVDVTKDVMPMQAIAMRPCRISAGRGEMFSKGSTIVSV